MKIISSMQSAMQSAFQPTIERLQAKYDQLQPRERIALLVLSVFLLVVGVGGAVFGLNHAANKAQERAIEQRQLLLWMRTQAPNIRLESTAAVPLNMLIQNTAQQQGLNVEQTPAGDQVQVAVTHQSFAVLGAWMTRLAEQGVSITQLGIEQLGTGELQLKATLALKH